jgi:hypothetical protein
LTKLLNHSDLSLFKSLRARNAKLSTGSLVGELFLTDIDMLWQRNLLFRTYDSKANYRRQFPYWYLEVEDVI